MTAKKRAFDIVISLCALIALAPLLLIAALAIRLSSPGPILFRALRVGLMGEEFTMHKFRTMHHNRAVHGPPVTSADDPRIFAAGRFLRSTKIDELPQFFDVLRGVMSVVGPRPEAPEIVERHYTIEQRRTLEVRPGITSAGAIWGYRNESLMADHSSAEDDYVNYVLGPKLAAEQAYLDSDPGLFSDIGIVFGTVAAILAQSTAPSGRQETGDGASP